jgi:3-hydroxybutyryl-CoA dehydrogenase
MVIAVLADDRLKEEWLARPNASAEIIWADSMRSLTIIEADAFVDLQFSMDKERIAKLKSLLPKPVIVNSVIHTVTDMREPFIRINAWPGMLKNTLIESVATTADSIEQCSLVFDALGWDYQLVPDIPGMVTPRIITMIINEAWYAFGEGISTKEEIDTAMKLGTNYPFGPFEWSEKIGIKNIISLLETLASTDPRYTMAPALIDLNKKDGLHFKY